MYEDNEVAGGDGYNNPRYEAYVETMVEENTDQNNIGDADYGKYIGSEVMTVVPVEGPSQETVRHRVENLDGEKVGTYHRNPLMDTHT